MTSSPKRNHANRINALKSTGPRSSKGKVISAMNSLSHGLAVNTSTSIADPSANAIRNIIQDELIDEAISVAIAQRIIQYEKTQAHHKNLYNENPNQPNDAEELMDQVGRLLGIDPHNIHDHGNTDGHYFEDVQIINDWLIADIKQTLISYYSKNLKKYNKRKAMRSAASVRYLRRATNQLIKSLKALDAV